MKSQGDHLDSLWLKSGNTATQLEKKVLEKLKWNLHNANIFSSSPFPQFSCRRLSSRGHVNQITATHVPQNMQQFGAARKSGGKLWGNCEETKRKIPGEHFFAGVVCVCAKNDVAQKIAVHNFRHFPATLRAAGALHVCCMPLCAPQQWPAYVAPEVMPVDDVAAFCVCVCGEGGVS